MRRPSASIARSAPRRSSRVELAGAPAANSTPGPEGPHAEETASGLSPSMTTSRPVHRASACTTRRTSRRAPRTAIAGSPSHAASSRRASSAVTARRRISTRAVRLHERACELREAASCVKRPACTRAAPAFHRAAPSRSSSSATACTLGDALACTVAAKAFANGTGVARDERRAADLLQRACAGGVATACEELERPTPP